MAKLADFGLAKSINSQNEKEHDPMEDNIENTVCGTPLYMAPEILTHRQYNSSADIWSCGVIFLELIMPYMRANQRREFLFNFADGKVDLKMMS